MAEFQVIDHRTCPACHGEGVVPIGRCVDCGRELPRQPNSQQPIRCAVCAWLQYQTPAAKARWGVTDGVPFLANVTSITLGEKQVVFNYTEEGW